ncbi:hypothetical protein BCV69DRAFT_279793 [Microstroma glucosiphilum]|uniref:Uncharacterized protein n=1 Tax=Pseudomicrostroma glucosiphilum TaxID=1684307 RepID=A0A316UG50_9BASI|nr:hypothetical protein BCV69DRAFT_279793 [Pseudomicrostroma glucosiphilum]PWN23884.1 hypothetical protein BCV69DRAFT_279793 [Pseudomicrostroma glucosiphilum]
MDESLAGPSSSGHVDGAASSSTTSAPSPSPLPPEIWSLVIYHLARSTPLYPDVVPSLSALTRVNKELSHFATPYLYARPRLDQRWKEVVFWTTILAHPERWWDVRSFLLGERQWDPFGEDMPMWIRGGRSGRPQRPTPKLDQLGEGIASAGKRRRGGVQDQGLATQAASGSAGSSSTSPWSKYLPSPPTNLQWAQAFQVPPSSLYLPIGAGPDPLLLEEVAWWEKGMVGGLLNGHAYSTRPVGKWCEQVERQREERKVREKAREVEDVDLGRGPGSLAASARTVPASESQSGSNSGGSGRIAPTDLSEEDVWAAAEVFAASATVVAPPAAEKTSTTSSSDRTASIALPSSVDQTQKAESVPIPPSSVAPVSNSTFANNAWALPATFPSTQTRRLPWRYRLITGSLDPTLPKLFHALDTLTHIELTLYPGTLLDHDLLEHQLRLLLDPAHMPLLRELLVFVGHDAVSSGSRLARLTHAKTVKLAVDRVDDRRCKCITARRTFGTAGCKGSEKDVKKDIIEGWLQATQGEHEIVCSDVDDGQEDPVVSAGTPWINGWLARDVNGTNDPIEE